MSSSRIPVAVVGATGLAGQQFLASLAGHPLFEAKKLVASSRSAGKKFADAIKDDKGASKWFCSEPLRGRARRHRGRGLGDDDHRRRAAGVLGRRGRRRARARAALRRRRAGHLDRQRVPLRARRAGVPAGRELGPRGADRRAAQEARLEGVRLARPELHHGRPGDHAQAARRRVRRVARDHDVDAGAVGRGPLARRVGDGHPRQHRPLHPQGRREGREGDARRSSGKLSGDEHRARAGDGVVHLHARQRASRATPSRCSSS